MIDANYPAAIPVSASPKRLAEQPRSAQASGKPVVLSKLYSVGR